MDLDEEYQDSNHSEFPIFSYEEFDLVFNQWDYRIGLKSTYPEELIRRIAAAYISYQLGNRGIDHVYKIYLKEKRYALNGGSRLDLRVCAAIGDQMESFSGLIRRVTEREPATIGEMVAEWTFLRVPFSMKFLLTCANRGAFFESIAVARMILEQIAWASKIDQLSDAEQIQKTSARKAIGDLKSICLEAGPLYGWLSSHAHWEYQRHIKARNIDEKGGLQALFATPTFKILALALKILMSIIAIKTFKSIKTELIGDALVQALKTHDVLRSLLDEIETLSQSDDDVRTMVEITAAVCA